MKESSSYLIMPKGMEHEDESRDRTRLMSSGGKTHREGKAIPPQSGGFV